MMEKLPTIEMRTNGSALGSNLKGHFRTTEFGSVKLYVNAQNPPFIYLETNDEVIIFNMKNEIETKEIFEKLQRKIK
ncbi:MAG: hypothetical protein ACOX4V_11705 [Anaerovoracaceae bacterium]